MQQAIGEASNLEDAVDRSQDLYFQKVPGWFCGLSSLGAIRRQTPSAKRAGVALAIPALLEPLDQINSGLTLGHFLFLDVTSLRRFARFAGHSRRIG